MKIEIVFTSSYSSQLGAIISLSEFFKKTNFENHSKNIIVFHISSKGDKRCNYSCFKDSGKIIFGADFHIRIIKINTILKRLVLLLFLSAGKIFGLNNYLSIWEPSPNWLERLFCYGKVNLNFIKNYFKDTKYYGDGFLCLSETSIPFWLNKENFLIENKNNNKNNIFYYLYSLNSSKNKKHKYIQIEAEYIKNIFRSLHTQTKIIKNRKYENLIIFPLTTFFETNRSSLESEISLYIDYLNQKINKNKDILLIKQHPGTLEIKKKLLLERLKAENFQIINNKFEKNQIMKLPLKIIPLELLCSILVEKLNINENDISIALNSNATLSTSYLFPKIKCIEPFGKTLIYKYIKKEFAKKRIIQEQILIKKIYQNKI